jgi:polyisoprenoid-binding protein YceI
LLGNRKNSREKPPGCSRLRSVAETVYLGETPAHTERQNTNMKSFKLIAAAILCSLGLTAYGADTFKIDPVHSSVIFSVKHLGVTDFYGDFREISGTVAFDAADPAKSSVDITVPVEKIDTRNEKRDQHLKSPDFFNAKQFPTLTFKSTKVEGAGDTYSVTGDLTIHGVTKPVTVQFRKGAETKGQQGETRTGGEAKFTIKRSDYGMTFMNGPLGDDVNIILSLEGTKQ